MVEQCHYQVIPFVKGASSRVVVDVGESRGVVVAGVGDARWPPKWPQSIWWAVCSNCSTVAAGLILTGLQSSVMLCCV